MDQELIAYLDARFQETWKQIESLREETSRRFEQVEGRFERVETVIRQTQVSVEGVRSEMRLVAEGVMGVEERLQPARKEYDQEFENIRALVRTSYTNLDVRTDALESWRKRTERNPLDLIREKFGKPPG
jgi:DNA repair ATPase RecN